jgi:uncharacterized protein YbaP (TraB family)
MLKNFKHSLAVPIISCFITVIGHPQSADTLKAATIQEKSETITFRMEKELALTKEQSTDVMKVLIERFQESENRAKAYHWKLQTVKRFKNWQLS